MRYTIRKRHSIFKAIIPLCLFVLIFSIWLLKRAEPVFLAKCSDYSNWAFTKLVNECISNASSSGEFGEFFTAVYDEKERVASIEANTARINTVTAELMTNIQDALNNDYPAYVNIPLGSVSRFALLTSYGPQMKIKLIPISIVNCEFGDEFESVGINQVRHKLYLDVYVDMCYVGYTLNETERIHTSVPLAETVYSGEVPQFYGGGMAGEIAVN